MKKPRQLIYRDSRNGRPQLDLYAERFVGHLRVEQNGCVVYTGSRQGFGYGCFFIHRKRVTAHRWIWEQLRGPIPQGIQVLHKCDNPPCVNVQHLFLGTAKDNMQDKHRKGRGYLLRWPKNPKCKLTPDAVREARALHEAGASLSKLAERYRVTAAAISNAIRGKSWSHIPMSEAA